MGAVVAHLADDLVPELAAELLEPDPRAVQFGKERADDDQANQTGGIVIGSHGGGLFEMLLDEVTVLLEQIEQFAGELRVDGRIVLHIPEGERDMHGARARFHCARPLHAKARRAVGAKLPDGRHICARPCRPLLRCLGKPARLAISPEVLQPAHFPGRFGVGAGLEEVDRGAGLLGVVADLGCNRVAPIVDRCDAIERRCSLLLAIFPFAKDGQRAAPALLRLAHDIGAGLWVALAQ